jgi:hypothetical protein
MLRKLLFSFLLLAGVAGGVAAYLWHQGTALPEWYEEELQALESLPPDADAAEAQPGTPLQWSVIPDAPTSDAAPKSSPKKKKGRREMRNFHLRSGASSKAARKAFRASRATMEDGKLEAGVVVNVSKVDRKELSGKEKEFFKRLKKAFPPLAKRDVYVALEDEPVTGPDGFLQLGPNPHVRVGELSYSLKSLAKKLGLNQSSIRKDINAEFRRLKVRDPEDMPSLTP